MSGRGKNKVSICIMLLLCTLFFHALFSFSLFCKTAEASERLSDFSDLVKSIDAEAEKPASKKKEQKDTKNEKNAKNEKIVKDVKPVSKNNSPSGNKTGKEEDKRFKEFAEAAGEIGGRYGDEGREDDRLKKFAEAAGEIDGRYGDEDREDDRLKEFAEAAGEIDGKYGDPDGVDERLKEFAEVSGKIDDDYGGRSEIPDERLTEFAKESKKTEKEYEKKYGPVIEDHVITDPDRYNDGDRVVATANTGVFKNRGVKTPEADKTEADGDSEERQKGTENVKQFFENLFFRDRGDFSSAGPSDSEEDVFYHDKTDLGVFTLTAYDACIECCGKTDGITATGTKAEVGRTIAVDPTVIPYGSRVMINGHVYTAEDTGSLIKGNKIDIYMNTHEEAKKFGRKTAEVFLLK